MSDWHQVGTVEILRLRVYPIDPRGGGPLRTEVLVEPGVYPVYRQFGAYRWMMTGLISERNEQISDGLFVLHASDHASSLEVVFSSPVFGADEFAELLTEPMCQPGADQRLRFELTS